MRSCEKSPKRTQGAERGGYKELPLLDIDHVNVGAYIRNTHGRQEHDARERCRHLPRDASGEPTLDTRRTCFSRCSSIPTLRPLASPGEDEHAARPRRARHMRCAKEDIVAVFVRWWTCARQGRDRRHRSLGNRRVRSVGELMKTNTIGLLAWNARSGAHVLGGHRHRDAQD